MESVLISNRPKWCEKICCEIGKDKNSKPIYEKRIEVRKSKPSEVPFKCYIYCTKDKPYLYRVDDDNNFELTNTLRPKTYEYVKDYNEQNGKVIGEFICNEVEEFHEWELSPQGKFADFERERLENFLTVACLSEEEVVRYRENLPYFKPLYGWHISDLKIYDKPKELSEFYTIPESGSDCCCGCVWHETPLEEMPCRTCTGERKYLYRPPQSWQYVEELEK